MKQIRPKTIEGYKAKIVAMSVQGQAGCIEFIGNKSPKGYGKIKFFRKDYRAHRLVYILKNGAIPDGLIVCHRCDNPGCINIEHLFLGTPKDNALDRTNKGRGNNQHRYRENGPH